MAEMLKLIKNKLMSAVEIDYDENNLIIILNVKGEIQKSDILAEPQEVKDMLQILGGLKEDIFMKIDVDNNARNIKLEFQIKEDLEKVKKILEHIWERTIHLFEELEKGNSNILRGVGDFSD
ncbi:MAG: hypothetical protein EU535_02585 [Promethearchaeota archaeon]|nr:MAG: hypothetical protein EU535_02585 [Candidatus Lokiarchaeota archaeon]